MSGQNTSQGNNFLVKVKLLTNETFQILTHPDILISQFKKLVQEKTKVPVDRQKIVFGGKSLIDEKPLKQYIHQSGLTVHLIAKSSPPANNNPQENPQPPTPPQPNTNPQNNNHQQPNLNMINPFANLFGAIQNPPSDPNQFSLNIGNTVNSLFGNLGNLGNMGNMGSMGNMGNSGNIGIRVVHGTINGQPIVNNNQPQVPNNQPNSQPQSNPTQNNTNQSQPTNNTQNNNVNTNANNAQNPPHPNVVPTQINPNNQHQNHQHLHPHSPPSPHIHNHSQPHHHHPPPPPSHYPPSSLNRNPSQNNQNPNNPRLFEPLQQLQVSLNRVNNPYNFGPGASLQQTTINYFKRMQSQMLRTAAQLNRSIHMLQQGHTMQLPELIPVFQALSNANLSAIDLIHRHQPNNNNRMNNQFPQQNNLNLGNQQNNQNNQRNANNVNNSEGNQQMPEIHATIIIEEEVDVDISGSNPNSFQSMFRNQNFMNQLNGQRNQGVSNNQPNHPQSSSSQQGTNNQQQRNSQPQMIPQTSNNSTQGANQQQTNTNQQEINKTQKKAPNPPQTQPQPPQQPNVMNQLGNALNSNGGFNFANLFAPQRPSNPSQNPNPNPSNNPTFNMTSSNTAFQNPLNQQQAQFNPLQMMNPLMQPNTSNQPNPQNPFQGMNFMNLFGGNPGNSQPPQNQNQSNPPNQANQQNQQNQQNQSQNPLQGINIMGLLGNLQQNGGIGSLLGMSIGSMLQQQGQDPTVYSAILAPISGSQVMGCFTQKDFSFINRKRQHFRDSVLRAISIAGSRQDLVNKYTDDLQNLMTPRQNIDRAEICKAKVKKIIKKYVERVINNFLHASPEADLTELIMTDIKRLYCESIDEISKHTQNLEIVFMNMKRNVVSELDKIAPGLSEMFYSLVERDLIRVYREYEQQKKRKQAQSQEQAKDQADLIRRIQQASKQDVVYMASFEHSKFYPQQKKQ